MGYIYIFTNIFNNKQYVGMTKRKLYKRLYAYKYKSNEKRPIIYAIKKYGYYNFDIEYFECENSMLIDKEAEMIEKYNTIVPNGYNIEKRYKQHNSKYISEKNKTAWKNKQIIKYGTSKIEELLYNKKFIEKEIKNCNMKYSRYIELYNKKQIYSGSDLFYYIRDKYNKRKNKNEEIRNSFGKEKNSIINNLLHSAKYKSNNYTIKYCSVCGNKIYKKHQKTCSSKCRKIKSYRKLNYIK